MSKDIRFTPELFTFLRELKAHLDPGGVAYFNTTGSLDVPYTAAGVWRHVIRVSNFVAASALIPSRR